MYATLENFTTAIRKLAELRDEGLARLAIGPDGDVAVGIDPKAANAPVPGGGLFADIFDALTAVANASSVEEFAGIRSEPRPGFQGIEDDATSRAKFEATAAAFSRDELKRRVWLRATSKLPVFAAVEWEVLVKEADSRVTTSPAERIPLAQVRFVTQRGSRAHFPNLEEFVTGMDLEDVGDVIRELERLQAALVHVTESRPLVADLQDSPAAVHENAPNDADDGRATAQDDS
jgi:hypothetical protein